jgi:hypothetical protein
MDTGLIIAIIVIPLLIYIVVFNGLVKAHQKLKGLWSGIDMQLI